VKYVIIQKTHLITGSEVVSFLHRLLSIEDNFQSSGSLRCFSEDKDWGWHSSRSKCLLDLLPTPIQTKNLNQSVVKIYAGARSQEGRREMRYKGKR